MKDKLYFVGLKAFIVNNDGSLLILQGGNQMEKDGLWGLPGGRIMEGEEDVLLVDVLRREIKEECGDIKVDVGEPFCTWRLHLPTKPIFLVGYVCNYISGEVTLSDEHISYQWIQKKDIDALSFVDGYKQTISDFFKKKNLLE